MSRMLAGAGVNDSGSLWLLGVVGAVPTLRGLTPTPKLLVTHSLGGRAGGAVPGPRGLTPTPINSGSLTLRLAKPYSRSNLPSLLGVSAEMSLLFCAGVRCGEPTELELELVETSETVESTLLLL